MVKSEKWPSYNDYLKSPEWSKLRGMVLDMARHRCQLCNSGDKLHVHHRVYDARWGEESTDDLTALCESCHHLFHQAQQRIKSKAKAEKKKENIAKDAANKKAAKRKKKKPCPISLKTKAKSGPVKVLTAEEIRAHCKTFTDKIPSYR
jgi:hypothetical protein